MGGVPEGKKRELVKQQIQLKSQQERLKIKQEQLELETESTAAKQNQGAGGYIIKE